MRRVDSGTTSAANTRALDEQFNVRSTRVLVVDSGGIPSWYGRSQSQL
jgi:hypothetical protein